MDCIYYDKWKLLEKTKLPLYILKTENDVFKQCAMDMANVIEENNAKDDISVIVAPIGPIGQYPIFVKYVNDTKLSLEKTHFVLMDGYVENDKDLPYNHRLSLRRRMDELLFNQIDEELKPKASNIIGVEAEDVLSVNRKIDKLGKIDFCVAGIGINGHIGFNEQKNLNADDYLAQATTRILDLSIESRLISAINNYKGALCEIPTRGITLGLKEMMSANKITAYCFREWHNSVVKRVCCESPSGNFPATILQLHKNSSLYAHESIVSLI
ncbi:MAG: glucosamine-6-phosphate isomerase [Clostridia bacterium]